MTQLGPVTAAAMQQMYAAGALDATSPVWCDELPNWTTLGDVPELKPAPPARQPTSPYAAHIGKGAAGMAVLAQHEANAVAQGDAANAQQWRSYRDFVAGLVDQLKAPGAGPELQSVADQLTEMVDQVAPL